MIALRIDRALFALLMGLTTAATTYIAVLITSYLPGTVGAATIVFMGALASVIIVYLSTEQANLPAQPPPSA